VGTDPIDTNNVEAAESGQTKAIKIGNDQSTRLPQVTGLGDIQRLSVMTGCAAQVFIFPAR
jgi:hypothetical protein